MRLPGNSCGNEPSTLRRSKHSWRNAGGKRSSLSPGTAPRRRGARRVTPGRCGGDPMYQQVAAFSIALKAAAFPAWHRRLLDFAAVSVPSLPKRCPMVRQRP
jgi:hypothetical protein